MITRSCNPSSNYHRRDSLKALDKLPLIVAGAPADQEPALISCFCSERALLLMHNEEQFESLLQKQSDLRSSLRLPCTLPSRVRTECVREPAELRVFDAGAELRGAGSISVMSAERHQEDSSRSADRSLI
ncbi:hypothetical protein FQA47_025040 [Oryzias melastigma]|uniref:Uncharacterized protein n=1 Tax=Oryzias melastigma TaxID=30732 RepID=A0A834FGM7_ORYME|nr:hypothetical protein FQA47_025040 [Oryzias melastigma]